MESKKLILPKWLVDKNYRVRLTDVVKYQKPYIQLDHIKFPSPKTK